ncbi:DUF2269 domain-containing protein [Oceanobacillus halophilus]|uniref:DUF2269 domain-containing protein n=1 Tax=Oceanobacillus halophilus TaxID=930130 RepID=A0A495A164_9BACI|nr:DUF2269 domain-containing protein [Oceanobacillus halophilus]RKQ33203.1 DUF2269 domain-containing protein [Oceanobacillus halophilus]
MTFYGFLVFIHVFSAIIGMGPGLIMTFVVTQSKPSNMTELRHAFKIRNSLHILTMVGGTLLLITGIWMGYLNPYWFTQGWYITSLILFLIALAFGPFLLKPKSVPIKKLLKEYEGEEIPKEYYQLSKRLFNVEHVENLIFVVIIALMILKPF